MRRNVVGSSSGRASSAGRPEAGASQISVPSSFDPLGSGPFSSARPHASAHRALSRRRPDDPTSGRCPTHDDASDDDKRPPGTGERCLDPGPGRWILFLHRGRPALDADRPERRDQLDRARRPVPAARSRRRRGASRMAARPRRDLPAPDARIRAGAALLSRAARRAFRAAHGHALGRPVPALRADGAEDPADAVRYVLDVARTGSTTPTTSGPWRSTCGTPRSSCSAAPTRAARPSRRD